MKQCIEIQRLLKVRIRKNLRGSRRRFAGTCFAGQISKALKFIDNEADAAVGVLPITDDIVEALEGKHPDPGQVVDEVLLEDVPQEPEEVIYESI